MPGGGIDDPEELLAAFQAQLADHDAQTSAPDASEEAPKQTLRERVVQAADPALVARLEARRDVDLIRTPPTVTYLREMPTHLDPAVWRTGFLDVHEAPIPAAMWDMLHDPVPQALLRDLFRPVFSEPRAYHRMETGLDPGARRAFELIQESQRREAPVTTETLSEAITRRQNEWRAFLREPWRPWLDDEAPRREVFV